VGQASLQMENLDISLCVWIWSWSLLCLLGKSNNWWVVFCFAPNCGNCEWHLAQTIYPSCEKPHAFYTTNIRGPTLILVTRFTPKIKLITFLHEWCKILHQRFEGQFSRCQDDLNPSLTWLKHN
jgi:hypothetical protein